MQLLCERQSVEVFGVGREVGTPGGLAADFYRELKWAEEEILMQPEFWRPVGQCYRRKLLNRFPYGLGYHQLDDGVLEVVALTHLSRKPGYWQGRSR